MNLLLTRGKENNKNNDLKSVLEGSRQKQLGKDINERYAEKLLKQIKNSDAIMDSKSFEKIATKVSEDMKKIEGLSLEKLKEVIYKKLKEIEYAITQPINEKLLIMLIHGWDAAFGPKPKK